MTKVVEEYGSAREDEYVKRFLHKKDNADHLYKAGTPLWIFLPNQVVCISFQESLASLHSCGKRPNRTRFQLCGWKYSSRKTRRLFFLTVLAPTGHQPSSSRTKFFITSGITASKKAIFYSSRSNSLSTRIIKCNSFIYTACTHRTFRARLPRIGAVSTYAVTELTRHNIKNNINTTKDTVKKRMLFMSLLSYPKQSKY